MFVLVGVLLILSEKNMSLNRWQSAISTVLISGLLTCTSAQAAPSDSVVLSNSFKPFPESVRVIDAADPAALIEFDVALKMRNYDALLARIDRREIVPNADMESTHFPLRTDHAALTKWLEASGLSVKKAYDNRLTVRVVGTVAQVQAALGVEFAKVSVDGQEYIAAKTAPAIPQFLTGFILGINGLQPYQKLRPANVSRSQPNSPTSAFTPPYSVSDIKTAYQATGVTTTGAGQRIAILIDTFPLDSDLTTFWSANNVSQSLSNIEKIQAVSGTLPATNLETSLDAEWTSGIASGARIRIYASQSLAFTNIDTTFQRIISDLNAGTVINALSISLVACESNISVSQTTTDNQFLSTIASRGVSILAASGDNGSTGTICSSGTGVDFFASSPNVTGVGGTALILNGAGVVTSETGWPGSGGGNSTRFSRPSWQVGAGVPSGTTRLVPDVALDADPNTGFYVILNGGVVQVGGTSASAPTWAGFIALINQGRVAAGQNNLGFLNPTLYPLLGTSSFRDITSGSNGAYSAAVGYDRVTGIGVPVVGTLYNTLVPVPTQVFAVSQDPTIISTSSILTAPASYGTISTSAIQYFANGATFSAIGLRNLLDFYGVAIPKSAINIGQIAATGFQPFNSPRQNALQFNYCSLESSNSTAIFIGTTASATGCSFISSTTGSAVILGAPNQAPTPLPSPPTGSYAFTAFPNFPTGSSADTTVATTAPLFAFSNTVASASALSASDLAVYTTNKKPTRGNPVQVPVFFGAIVPALNASVNSGISPNLTTVELCKAFDRQITNYNQITSTASLNRPIQIAVRSDGNGTTSAFTAYLASACSSAGVVTPGYPGYYITAAVNVFPLGTAPSAAFIRRSGDDGVGDYIATTSGGFGYIEAAFSQPIATNAPITPNTPAPIQAALQNPISNSFLTATLSNVRNALANIGLSADPTYPCVLRATGLPVVPTVGTAYPIITQAYALTFTNYPTQGEVNAVKGLFSFILGNRTTPIQANDQIAQAAGLILLGQGTATSTINPLRSQARACINSAKIGVSSN
jgi:kumamolisin